MGIISSKLVIHREKASEMELKDMTGVFVADNTEPMTTIHISSSSRGKPVRRIDKMLLEVEKGVSLALDATNLRVGSEQPKENG